MGSDGKNPYKLLQRRSRKYWKWTLVLIICFVFLRKSFKHPRKRRNKSSPHFSNFSGWKILYIVTTLAEYDNGRRATTKGFDRFKHNMVPVISESVKSMRSLGFQVDVVVIAHYNMTRSHLIRDALPDGVGLQIWDQATPLGYKLEEKDDPTIHYVTRALARQHRFVIKDKLPYYNFFVNFEDDMLIKGETVANYIEMSVELERLRSLAPDEEQNKGQPKFDFSSDQFYGVMNQRQLSQFIPGFIRVEAIVDNGLFRSKKLKVDEIVPITDRPILDAEPCCQFLDDYIESDDLYLWETGLRALGVRKMPLQSKLDWVLMQRGRRVYVPDIKKQKLIKVDEEISDYWAGRDGYFEKDFIRPDTKRFKFLNNQGGWMATRRQIWEWHTEFCQGGFLPPYESPHFNLDGLDMRNVEYWSGGINIFTYEHGCNLQRIISLDPDRFARQLLYHTANNKHHQLGKRGLRFVNVNDFLGQLNTIRNNAKAEMSRRVNIMLGQ